MEVDYSWLCADQSALDHKSTLMESRARWDGTLRQVPTRTNTEFLGVGISADVDVQLRNEKREWR